MQVDHWTIAKGHPATDADSFASQLVQPDSSFFQQGQVLSLEADGKVGAPVLFKVQIDGAPCLANSINFSLNGMKVLGFPVEIFGRGGVEYQVCIEEP